MEVGFSQFYFHRACSDPLFCLLEGVLTNETIDSLLPEIPLLFFNTSLSGNLVNCAVSLVFIIAVIIGKGAFLEFMNNHEPEKAQRIMFYLRTRGADEDWRRTISTFLFDKQFRGFLNSAYYSDWCVSKYGVQLTPRQLKVYRDQIEEIYDDRIADFPEIMSFLLSFPHLQFDPEEDLGMLALISFVESIPLAIMLSYPDPLQGFPVVHANKTAADLLCEARLSLLGRRNVLLVPNSTAFESAADHPISRGVPSRNEAIICLGDNEFIQSFTLLSKPLYDADTHFKLILTVFTDDTTSDNINLVASFMMSCPSHF